MADPSKRDVPDPGAAGTTPADLATGAASSMPAGGGGVTGDFGGILTSGSLGHLTGRSLGHSGARLPTDGDPEDPDTAGKVDPHG